MADNLTKVIDCPICLETPEPPIKLCQSGHSICSNCIQANAIIKCPLCRGNMTNIRNFQLEQLIAGLQECATMPCRFAERDCKYTLSMRDKQSHESECRHRDFECEGKRFCGWPCKWRGQYGGLLEHFKGAHDQQSWMEFKTAGSLAVDFEKAHSDIQIISFGNGQQLFWYKFKLDVAKQKAYWIFQCVGPQKLAKNYYYEFEVYDGAVRKFKVNDVCESDVTDAESLFDSERCVTMGFRTLKTYTDKSGKVAFRFRIMKIKKELQEPKRR